MAKPTLVAEFMLDSHGSPEVAYKGDPNHYRIVLKVTDAPDDTYAVTYHLHESYYEPVRESRRQRDAFVEEVTSYGDYEVRASVRTRHGTQTLVADLSGALKRGHAANMNERIRAALSELKEN